MVRHPWENRVPHPREVVDMVLPRGFEDVVLRRVADGSCALEAPQALLAPEALRAREVALAPEPSEAGGACQGCDGTQPFGDTRPPNL